ncbi:peptidase, M23 family [Leptospira santarosai str. CBC1416]|uniref:Peptidase, M23 family n=1 Tax=Leptospira santarosai str. CBC1416 TaxID=1193059 RepID=M6VQ56_9LEPT|nr:peptidase, M23 family [Leptospira santarosai str. CBC1416]
MFRVTVFFLPAFFLFFVDCGNRLIRKDAVAQINEHYSERIYYLTKDKKVSSTEIFKKGMLVRIYVESTPSMVKIKCYPADHKREYAIGRMILYQLNDEYGGKKITIEDLDKLIADELVEYKKKNNSSKEAGSRSGRSVSDIKKVNGKLFFIPLISSLILGPIFADPLKNYDAEISEYTNKDSSFFSDKEERKIKQLFSQSPENWQEEKYSLNYHKDKSNLELPSFINVNKIISSRIVSHSGIIYKNYVVKPKDTLSKIARDMKTSVPKIISANGLKKNTMLQVGQNISVPIQVRNASREKVEFRKLFVHPVLNAKITSRYGRRKDPFHTGSRGFHTGLDFASAQGAPILAVADGIVSFAGVNGGYGNTVIVDHENGYKTMYAHCSKITIDQGTKVSAGTVIGAIGRTGSATGPHLHFEVFLNGNRVNPEAALKKSLKIVTPLDPGKFARL